MAFYLFEQLNFYLFLFSYNISNSVPLNYILCFPYILFSQISSFDYFKVDSFFSIIL